MNFVILAAGIGSRLRPLTDDMPKCCIEVYSESIIERLLSQIRSNFSSKNIIIVTGYKDDILRNKIGEHSEDITFVHNQIFDSTNNMYSAALGLKSIDIEMDTVIMNADCVYSDEIFYLIKAAKRSTIFSDGSFYDQESMKVKILDNFVISMSKELSKSKDIAVSIDLYFFKNKELIKLLKIFDYYISDSQLNNWTEVGINDLVSKDNKCILHKDINGASWYEIDTLDDLNKARELWKSM
tara:strand:+ start:1462 stop:2181 length:720 start_codon:yes stop_codon:yes gene_type:complete